MTMAHYANHTNISNLELPGLFTLSANCSASFSGPTDCARGGIPRLRPKGTVTEYNNHRSLCVTTFIKVSNEKKKITN